MPMGNILIASTPSPITIPEQISFKQPTYKNMHHLLLYRHLAMVLRVVRDERDRLYGQKYYTFKKYNEQITFSIKNICGRSFNLLQWKIYTKEHQLLEHGN
jgi:predicted mannosyl-3-phosphoglycerate phosphatase (HAD superfamily)